MWADTSYFQLKKTKQPAFVSSTAQSVSDIQLAWAYYSIVADFPFSILQQSVVLVKKPRHELSLCIYHLYKANAGKILAWMFVGQER